MSDNRISIGYAAEITTHIGNCRTIEWEEWEEKLSEYGLSINYDGTIVYSVLLCEILYEFNAEFNVGTPEQRQQFIDDVAKTGLKITQDTACSYVSCWYDGTDPYMSDLSLDTFREKKQCPFICNGLATISETNK